jgi:predicted nuclease of predicted toxin-antitoxin system
MTVWLDAHLDPALTPWLGSRFGVAAKALREIGLRDASDQVLFDAGGRFGDVVIATKDKDLVERVHRLGPPPRILWLRLGNMATIRMQSVLSRWLPDALSLLESGAAAVEITHGGVQAV